MNAALVNEAVKIAVASESTGPKDMTLFLHNSFGATSRTTRSSAR